MDVLVWPAWVGGAAIGLYMLLQFGVTGKALGCSTGYGAVCGAVSRHPRFRVPQYAPRGNWRIWFAIGLPLGGLVAALSSPGFDWSATLAMGTLYEGVLPSSGWARGLYLMGGGVLIGLGARMAGGCTAGHVITGVSLRNPPSLVAGAGFFVGGVVAVQLLFRLVA